MDYPVRRSNGLAVVVPLVGPYKETRAPLKRGRSDPKARGRVFFASPLCICPRSVEITATRHKTVRSLNVFATVHSHSRHAPRTCQYPADIPCECASHACSRLPVRIAQGFCRYRLRRAPCPAPGHSGVVCWWPNSLAPGRPECERRASPSDRLLAKE